MGVRVELMTKESITASATGLASRLPIRVYNINDQLTPSEIRTIERILADPIVDDVKTNKPILGKLPENSCVIEQTPKPGVTDPEGNEVNATIEKVIGRTIAGVSFSKQYLWIGELSDEEYLNLQKSLGNPLINEFRKIKFEDWNPDSGVGFHFPSVDLPKVPAFEYARFPIERDPNKPHHPEEGKLFMELSNEGLVECSKRMLWELSLEELIAIKEPFHNEEVIAKRKKHGLEAMPIDAEVECSAQTWSDHCIHKKFNGIWEYTTEDPNEESGLPQTTDSVFKSIIAASTLRTIKNKNIDWVVSIFEDNSGVIKINNKWNIAHKVETHNFPSTLDPFGGSNTGSGGVFRDPASTGIGMWVISSQYGFRVPHPNSYKDLPSDILPPAKILQGIVLGVEDYGNKMGIATQLGNVFIDDGWLKCGVYVGGVAVVPAEINGRKTHIKEINPGYIALSLGGRVGKDGVHGATAASASQDADAEKDKQVNQAVQIGNPIIEKKVFDVMEILRYQGLVEASQDCGAGGWNSAVGELARISNGAVMDLTNAPEKYKGLTGWEKLVSEAQEREVIVIKPENIDRITEICRHYNVEATKIADFNDSGFYQVIDQNKTIVFLPMEFLHKGLPKMTIKAHWKPYEGKEPDIEPLEDLTETLHKLLARPNVQNYDWITTRYDHEVQGGSLIKPLVGIGKARSEAIAYRPVLTEKEVVIESWGSNPWQGDIDAYHMGINNVVDAIGRTIAAGGNLNKITNNGNTTCPKPEKDPLVAAKVMRMLKGSADAEEFFGMLRISGKDSTSMQRTYKSTETGKEIEVKAKPELLISSLAVIDNDSTLTTLDFKLPGDIVYVVGETRDECGASEFYLMHGKTGKNVPKTRLAEVKKTYETLSAAIKKQLVHSAQYAAKEGLFYGLSNPAIGGDYGLDARLDDIDNGIGRADKLLGSETTGRFVVTVHHKKCDEFEKAMKGVYARKIGIVRDDKKFNVTYRGQTVISTDVDMLKRCNKGEIRF